LGADDRARHHLHYEWIGSGDGSMLMVSQPEIA
jgi:hypothetical protein